MANIANIRLAVLQALWTDVAPFPDAKEPIWWEVWLRRNPDTLEALEQIVAALQWEKASHWVMFPDRIVTAVLADVASLTKALGTRLPIAEIRHARFAESPAELPLDYQRDLSADLADRVAPCSDDGPSVCLLDTGGYRHTLLASSLSNDDMHYVVGTDAYDRRGHGTRMAGLALYGSLEEALGTLGPVALDHRLESVKIFPDPNTPPNAPDTYGFVTAAGALVAEQVRPDRRRAYCMAVTADGDFDGRPTLWSATLDALTFGTDVTKTDRGIELLTEPEPDKSRLFVVPAGNVDQQDYCRDYLTACDSHAVLDPAQSWNALTVGGFTKLVGVPAGRDFVGYSALAASGSLSPFSRTSRRFASKWPIKPEIVLEAGNLLISRGDPPSIYEHDVVSIVTTSLEEQVGRNPLGTISMTSAATAQAARLAAVASGHYPDLWPETIRGLLVHSAEWTGPMWNEVRPPATKTQRAELLKRYGYGVPTEERVLHSASNAVTLICQDWIQPYERDDGRTRLAQLRVHEFPGRHVSYSISKTRKCELRSPSRTSLSQIPRRVCGSSGMRTALMGLDLPCVRLEKPIRSFVGASARRLRPTTIQTGSRTPLKSAIGSSEQPLATEVRYIRTCIPPRLRTFLTVVPSGYSRLVAGGRVEPVMTAPNGGSGTPSWFL